MDTGMLIMVGALIVYPFVVAVVRAITRGTLQKLNQPEYCIKFVDKEGKTSQIVIKAKNGSHLAKSLKVFEPSIQYQGGRSGSKGEPLEQVDC